MNALKHGVRIEQVYFAILDFRIREIACNAILNIHCVKYRVQVGVLSLLRKLDATFFGQICIDTVPAADHVKVGTGDLDGLSEQWLGQPRHCIVRYDPFGSGQKEKDEINAAPPRSLLDDSKRWTQAI